jgi:hypothetical protein
MYVFRFIVIHLNMDTKIKSYNEQYFGMEELFTFHIRDYIILY